MNNTCIFCHNDSSTSQSVEHIIPESLGNKHHLLPRGYVCDKCNGYFAKKVEQPLLSQPYFISLRFRNEIRNKKGHLIKEKLYLTSQEKPIDVTLQVTEEGLSFICEDDSFYKHLETGNIKSIMLPYFQEPEYPNKIMSRFLAKCAYEYFLYHVGELGYESFAKEALGKENDLLKRLRKYARFGEGEYWEYNQRRIYSEGELFHLSDPSKIYERMQQMTLFIRNSSLKSNGQIESEIYFIAEIAGIEYTLCISDPQIIGYKMWLLDNYNRSPLEDEDENKKLTIGLSDINPLLMKKYIRRF